MRTSESARYLEWTGGSNSEPIWPREPDIDIVKSLASRHLTGETHASLDGDDSLDVSFFAEGAFNKLYKVCIAGQRVSYLFRVSVGIEPYHKTEREVATIAYLRANTSISVPCVIAWDSDKDNLLTFEWILMEKIDGVSLEDVWREVPWERKLELTETIAGMVKQMRDSKFDRIGSLYFTSTIEGMVAGGGITASPEPSPRPSPTAGIPMITVQDSDSDTSNITLLSGGLPGIVMSGPEPHTPSYQAVTDTGKVQEDSAIRPSLDAVRLDVSWDRPSSNPVIADLSHQDTIVNQSRGTDQPTFCINRIFDWNLARGSRLTLPGNRGPYRSSLEWMKALVGIQLEWIENGPVDNDSEYDSDFIDEAPTMRCLCREFFELLPTIFDDRQDEGFVLHHHDLNAANIIVCPDTFEIRGIVDWEMINIVPTWSAFEHPVFLQDVEPSDENEPPIPSYEDEDDINVLIRDRWDNRNLRNHFDEAMKRLSGGKTIVDEKVKVMRDCHEALSQLTGMWTESEWWLRTYQTTGESRNHADNWRQTIGEWVMHRSRA